MRDNRLIRVNEDQALVCWLPKYSEAGPGDWWYVRGVDGHLYDCGPDQERAINLADKLNQ